MEVGSLHCTSSALQPLRQHAALSRELGQHCGTTAVTAAAAPTCGRRLLASACGGRRQSESLKPVSSQAARLTPSAVGLIAPSRPSAPLRCFAADGGHSALGAAVEEATSPVAAAAGFVGLHHVGLLCADLDRALDFYCGVLGLAVNPARPDAKLPYAGKWLWLGADGSSGGMLHLMVLPNPDPTEGRPEHGGRDRHACVEVADVRPLREALERAGIPFTMSQSGRPAVFCRDPDGNALEFAQF